MAKHVGRKSERDGCYYGNGVKVSCTDLGDFGNRIDYYFVTEGNVRVMTQLNLFDDVSRVTESDEGQTVTFSASQRRSV